MQRRLRCLTVALVGLAAAPGMAQEAPAVPDQTSAAAFVEAAGNSFLGLTANLEWYSTQSMAVRIGAGADFYSQTTVFPLQAVFLIGPGVSKLEASAGVTIAQEHATGDWHWNGTRPFFTGFLGYRHQVPKGTLFRIGVIPLLWTNTHLPWVSVGFGATF